MGQTAVDYCRQVRENAALERHSTWKQGLVTGCEDLGQILIVLRDTRRIDSLISMKAGRSIKLTRRQPTSLAAAQPCKFFF